MRENLFGGAVPYNIEGDYQKKLLDISEKIDEVREAYEENPNPGPLGDVKRKVKSLIFKMSRNRKFYPKTKKGEDKTLTTKIFKELRKELDEIKDLETLEPFLDKLSLMTAEAGVFLKSFEEAEGGAHYE